MNSDNKDLALNTKVDTALEVASLISSIVPVIGSPVSNVLSGASFGRKIYRVKEVLLGVAEDIQDLRTEVSQDYIKSEDFEELLEHTLQQVAKERNKEKRHIYRKFLIDAISSPGEPYDEQTRFLRILVELQGDHIRILKACMVTPENVRGLGGSQSQTLMRRLPDIPKERIMDLVTQLNDMRITSLQGMSTMMTANGAEELRHAVTQIGQRFLKYLMEDEN